MSQFLVVIHLMVFDFIFDFDFLRDSEHSGVLAMNRVRGPFLQLIILKSLFGKNIYVCM